MSYSLINLSPSILSKLISYNDFPAPDNIPSSKAERTAQTASSTRSYNSFCSKSVLPPTKITPIPPVRDAMRSTIKSLSFFCFASLWASHSCFTRSSISDWFMFSFDFSITVLSRPTITFAACPKSS